MGFLPKSRKARRRLTVVAAAAPILALAVGLSLYAMRDSVVYFYGPAQARAEKVAPGRTVRLGGMVQEGSLTESADGLVAFTIGDEVTSIRTVYRGSLPDLFREGQGVVAEGQFLPSGDFQAETVLAKHDENYMPKEMVAALKESGEWQRGEAAPDGGQARQ